jgi:hypothetical protein
VSPEFVPAVELNAGFYREVVEPIVRAWPHGAALLGYGSELLGFDTVRSTDHGWGPRLQVFVNPVDLADASAAIVAGLPAEYRGWPVFFGWDDVPSTHHVDVVALGDWLSTRLGCNPLDGLSLLDWLVVPQQRLLGVVRGAVYNDDSGELAKVRERLRFFPDELIHWLVACQWRRIDQEEPFVGRAAEVGDEIGSRIVATRLVREVMRLHFLLVGEYWPYAKWFGSAYRALPHSDKILPSLEAALDAPDYPRREEALVGAYEALARLHNASGLTETLDPAVTSFHGRPFRVPSSDRFVQACLRRVPNDWLRGMPLIGSIDQVVDSTDVLEQTAVARALRALHGDASWGGATQGAAS